MACYQLHNFIKWNNTVIRCDELVVGMAYLNVKQNLNEGQK